MGKCSRRGRCCGRVWFRDGPLAKLLLVIFNTVFLASSIRFVFLGTSAIVDKSLASLQNLVDYGTAGRTMNNSGLVLLGFGFFCLIVSAFGYLAAYCAQKKRLVYLYIFLLFVIFCCGIAIAIVFGIFFGKVDSEFERALDKTVDDYGCETELATDWDYVQTWMKCCGSTGPKDYTNVTFQEKDMHVPITCCILTNSDQKNPNPENKKRCQEDAYMYQNGNTTSSKTLYTIGCYESLLDLIGSKIGMIIGLGIGTSVVQIFSIYFAIGICIDLSDDYISVY